MSNGKKVRDLEIAKLPFALTTLRRLPIPHKLGLLERLYGSALGKLGVVWVSCSNSVVWKLDLCDPCLRWIVYGDYEGSTGLDWVREWLSGGGVVIDSGANIGQMTLFMAPISDVSIYAFEPLESANRWLKACLEIQDGWSVKVLDFGLSEALAEIPFQCDGARSTSNMSWYQGKQLKRITVKVDTLDKFASGEGLARIRLWKLDVEGAELKALLGARQLLEDSRVDAIFFECSSTSFEEIQSYLNEVNYTISSLTPSGQLEVARSPNATTNLIAIPEQAKSVSRSITV